MYILILKELLIACYYYYYRYGQNQKYTIISSAN